MLNWDAGNELKHVRRRKRFSQDVIRFDEFREAIQIVTIEAGHQNNGWRRFDQFQLGANEPAKLQRDSDIEKNDFSLEVDRLDERLLSIGCTPNFATSRFQHTTDEFQGVRFIVNDQNT